MAGLQDYLAVWGVDFEYHTPGGERPDPICMVARELRSGATVRMWADELRAQRTPPFPLSSDSLFVSYFASAELGCFLELGWPMPNCILDLYAEYRREMSGLPRQASYGLLAALAKYGISSLAVSEKQGCRQLAIRGGPFTDTERKKLLEYCESDVIALTKLLPKMLPVIDLPLALLRGRHMAAVARMERTGTPIDVPRLNRLRRNWTDIRRGLIAEVDREFDVYDGEVFRSGRFAEYLRRRQLPWPRHESGRLDLSDDIFREKAKADPAIAKLRELRHTVSQLRLENLAVGSDGRNRCLLSPFASKTGRNQPSNSKFIFGPSVWLRGLIKPNKGCALAYIDYAQQEFGIAAALSGDPAMIAAYESGDPYLAFAKQAGAVPASASKESHPRERALYKQCVLAVQYGMGARSLGQRIGRQTPYAQQLLDQHRRLYSQYWEWSDRAVNHALFTGSIESTYGWRTQVGMEPNVRSLANFPCQANGAEMLRLACILGAEAGIDICAPVHDAVLIEAAADEIDDTIERMRAAMTEASTSVTGGMPIRTTVEQVVRYPNRFMDEDRGRAMWETVERVLRRVDPLRPRLPKRTGRHN